MASPGQYVADATEGIARVEDLPEPQIIERSRNFKRCRCPKCDCRAYRLRTSDRTLHDLALPKSHYTHRVVQTAVRLVVEDGLPYRSASGHLWRDHRVFVPFATIQNWVEAGGEKGRATRPV